MGQPLSYLYLGNRQHRCANTSDSSAKEGLLTAQACPLSEASLSRQQVFGTFCAKALADCILCCCSLWVLQLTAVLCCHACKQNILNLCVLHTAQLPSQGCVSSPVLPVHCCCLHQSAISSTVAFLIHLTPKGVVFFSFPFLSFPFLSFPFLSFPFLSFPFLFFSFLFFLLFSGEPARRKVCWLARYAS